ncbi:MAG TPA: DDE-type integrase/transposase/recombinase [Vicinamibacteria bacterium]|jgi:transposase InsO family protein
MPTRTSPPEEAATPPLRLLLRHKLEAQTEKLALRAVLNAAHLLGLATGVFLRELRGWNDPLAEAAARLKEAQLQAKLAWEIVEILGARLDKLGDRNIRRRPYYTPVQRFRILEIKNLLGWNRNFAAHLFRVCSNTISNWEKHADPSSNTVGSPLDAVPPVVRLQDVTRRLIQSMLQLGMGGEEMVARTLARAGWPVSTRSVRRIRKEAKTPSPTPLPPSPANPTTPVVARFVGHVLMMDVSVVRSFLGGELYLAAVFDAFSRVPIALATYQTKPGSAAMAKLLNAAAKIVSTPKYVLTDRGSEFTGKPFAKTVSHLGAIHRFGSVDCLFATARIERFWRSIKDLAALRLHPPLTIEDLDRRLESALTYYVIFRPHQGLDGATPAEALLGLDPAFANAVKPPRGRPGEGPSESPFVIDFLDRESRTFPFLRAA